jgi:hypothetical protein
LSGETLILPQFTEAPGFTDYVTDFIAAHAGAHLSGPRYSDGSQPGGRRGGVALVMDSWRSLAMANVVYRGIVDYERVIDMVLAHRTRENAPAFVETTQRIAGLGAKVS